MRNITHRGYLILTTPNRDARMRERKRKNPAPPLASLGSRVGIAVPNFRKRRGQPQSAAISSRSLEQAWLKEHRAEYPGAWVALEGASLVAKGSSAREVLEAARAKGYEQPLVVHIPGGPELPFGGW